ncbi:efflux RND transporter periplasmic adaptor subunit [Candidatus Pristimantibacillus sp. PTI5]|uniref:efflux RND transporter periplasmic adaptor subunit n=1 Tax=Candidatus Pristimantibacillus sp. PTI5 TaxID=3400422 RepID=UPI003B017BD0
MEKLYRRRLMKHRLYSLIPRVKHVAVMLAAMLALTGCSLLPLEEASLQPPLVQPAEEELDIVDAAKGNIQTFLKGTANFVSSSMDTLSFKESGGRLKSINVTVGQEVKAGDMIAQLETGDLELQIRLQRLSVERARLQYEQARASGANATDLRLREIDLERESLMLDSMEERLGQSQLYAPIAGIVTFAESLNAGDFINAYQAIVTIADPSKMQLTYKAANSKDLLPVEAGMPVSLKYKGKDYKGKVLQSPSNVPLGADDAKAERNSVTIIIGMNDKPEGVQIGHSAELNIELQKRENVILLPRSAIRSYMGRSYVQVAEGDRRKEVDVEVGLTTPTEVEIVRGLEEGEKVILNN